jgi:hypothetical protein
LSTTNPLSQYQAIKGIEAKKTHAQADPISNPPFSKFFSIPQNPPSSPSNKGDPALIFLNSLSFSLFH